MSDDLNEQLEEIDERIQSIHESIRDVHESNAMIIDRPRYLKASMICQVVLTKLIGFWTDTRY